MSGNNSKRYWNRAARDNAAWHVATGHLTDDDNFFASGEREVDFYLDRAGIELGRGETVVEIGCGIGRMTRRLAARAGTVVATDISSEMLDRAKTNLHTAHNVEFVEVSGDGDLPLPDASVDGVFSYITMQHVPTATAQERYFIEALRIVRPGGWVLIQYRKSGVWARTQDWAGHVAHRIRGRRTLSRSWRGARIGERTLLAHASPQTSIEILPFGSRHIWVRARIT